ncbi:hypothetical protein [Thermococcus sp. MV11]|uniref:hypothetical protein n=1 Tax=Thermococcus sp. MV11 TaxID=1638267 RepID=UPI00143128AB|nr:hypothetical protein [Thermococcus sp. MV11]NJE02617.1 hypothetical protein [Thermococcus sp. MV11]
MVSLGAADVLATLVAVFFLALILAPFVPGGPALMLLLLGLLPLAILVVLLVKVWQLSDEVEVLRKELESLRREKEDGKPL